MVYRRIDRWLLLSVFVPILGGILGYWQLRNEDSRLATLLLAGTFAIPVWMIGGFSGYAAGGTAALGVAGGIVAAIATGAILVWASNENPYHRLLWAAYFSIFGALYLYYGPYEEQPRLRRAAKKFAVRTAVVVLLALLLTPLIPFLGVALFGFV